MAVSPSSAYEIFTGPFNLTQAVAFTFFIGSMAMMAATAFFWLSIKEVSEKWKTSLIVSGLITFIAAVHYFYMRDFYLANKSSPTFFRYVDWALTVPLMCVEFYLITQKAGAKVSTLWKLIIASVLMLVTGYIGEAVYGGESASWVWGFISSLPYFYIVYLVWVGEIAQLAQKAGPDVQIANRVLAWFVLVGWAIYPIGYIIGTRGGLFGYDFGISAQFMDVIYNIGDSVNKIGFGLVVYVLARRQSVSNKA